jgi:hypothetical protein
MALTLSAMFRGSSRCCSGLRAFWSQAGSLHRDAADTCQYSHVDTKSIDSNHFDFQLFCDCRPTEIYRSVQISFQQDGSGLPGGDIFLDLLSLIYSNVALLRHIVNAIRALLYKFDVTGHVCANVCET